MPIEAVVAWEQMCASRWSPGPVLDAEAVYRQLLDPIHWNSELNELKPDAFSDITTIGLSVNRITHTSLPALCEAAQKRVRDWNSQYPDKPQRRFYGFAMFHCSELRKEFRRDGDPGGELRLFGVYDTAKSDDISHGDILRLADANSDKKIKARAKAILWELATHHKGKYLIISPKIFDEA